MTNKAASADQKLSTDSALKAGDTVYVETGSGWLENKSGRNDAPTSPPPYR